MFKNRTNLFEETHFATNEKNITQKSKAQIENLPEDDNKEVTKREDDKTILHTLVSQRKTKRICRPSKGETFLITFPFVLNIFHQIFHSLE